LSAYRVPESVRSELYDEITPVNSLRSLFRGMFGMELPRLADDSHYSTWSEPMRFVRVER
jgi:hypothetical protein